MSEIHVPDSVDVEALRDRLRKMTSAELLRLGRSVNRGKPPQEAFVLQSREVRAEWRKRFPKLR